MTPIIREHVLQNGPGTFTDKALLEIVTGGQSPTAATTILPELAWATPNALVALGYSPNRAALLAAAFELGRRAAWVRPQRGDRLISPRRVYDLAREWVASEVERFGVVLLDARLRLMRFVEVAKGSIAQVPANPADILRPAIREAAHSLIFVHNHPSGDPSPSPEDHETTQRLRHASQVVGLVARDHVIVAEQGFYSFAESGTWVPP
jgi:DNA repair protein RadC